MNIFYNNKTDYLEIFRLKVPNYGEPIRKGIIEFRAEKNDKVVGYGIENATRALEKFACISPIEKFSVFVKIARIKHGLTQVEAAKNLGMKLLPYQRIESGSNNPTLKTILKIKSLFPEISLSDVA